MLCCDNIVIKVVIVAELVRGGQSVIPAQSVIPGRSEIPYVNPRSANFYAS